MEGSSVEPITSARETQQAREASAPAEKPAEKPAEVQEAPAPQDEVHLSDDAHEPEEPAPSGLMSAWSNVSSSVSSAVDGAREFVQPVVDQARDLVQPVVDQARSLAQPVVDQASSLADQARDLVQPVVDQAVAAAQPAVDLAGQVADAAQPVLQQASDIAQAAAARVEQFDTQYRERLNERPLAPQTVALQAAGEITQGLGQGIAAGGEWVAENAPLLSPTQRGAIVGVTAGAGGMVEGIGQAADVGARLAGGDPATLQQARDLGVAGLQAGSYVAGQYIEGEGTKLAQWGLEGAGQTVQGWGQAAQSVASPDVARTVDMFQEAKRASDAQSMTWAGQGLNAMGIPNSLEEDARPALEAGNSNPVVQATRQAVQDRLEEYRTNGEFAIARDVSPAVFEVGSLFVAPEALIGKGGTVTRAAGETTSVVSDAARIARAIPPPPLGPAARATEDAVRAAELTIPRPAARAAEIPRPPLGPTDDAIRASELPRPPQGPSACASDDAVQAAEEASRAAEDAIRAADEAARAADEAARVRVSDPTHPMAADPYHRAGRHQVYSPGYASNPAYLEAMDQTTREFASNPPASARQYLDSFAETPVGRQRPEGDSRAADFYAGRVGQGQLSTGYGTNGAYGQATSPYGNVNERARALVSQNGGESHLTTATLDGETIELTSTGFNGRWTHTELSEEKLDKLMNHVDALYARAMDPNLPVEETVKTVGEMQWWLSQTTPFKRGSASATEALTRGVLDARGIQTAAYHQGLSPDLEAFVTPLDEFVKRYPNFFIAPPR